MRALRLLVIFFALTATTSASAQGPRRSTAPGFQPTTPKLTARDVQKMVVIIPELAEASATMKGAAPMGAMDAIGGAAPNVPMEDLERVERLLNKYGYTAPEFFMQLAVLVSTYLALNPEEFERQLPSENTPEIKKILDDPKVSASQKKAIRQRIKMMRANKDQLLQLASDENKKVVQPLMAQVGAALKKAEEVSARARQKPAAVPAKGPRK